MLQVGNLVKAGAIARTAHAAHGRILQLQATARGRALLKRCRGRVAGVEAEIAALLSVEEGPVIRRWLSALAERLAEGR